MMDKRDLIFLAALVFFLIFAVSTVRLANPALAGQSDPGEESAPSMMGPSPAGGDYLRFPTVDRYGRGGKAFGMVDIPSTLFQDIDGITIDGWIFFEKFPAVNQAFMLFQKPEGFQVIVEGSADPGYNVSLNIRSLWTSRDGRGRGGGGSGAGFDLATNTWYYFYCQFQAKYEGYLVDDTNLPLAIGAKCFNFDLQESEGSKLRLILDYIQFSGGIDELRISNNLRYYGGQDDVFVGDSPPEHGPLVELPRRALEPDDHTVALWHFDDPDGFFTDAKNGFVIRPYGWLDPKKERPEPYPIRSAEPTLRERWVFNPSNQHFYRVINCGSWLDCEEEAEAKGAHLVTINDEEEQRWLMKTFGGAELCWIGLTDELEEGNWQWSNAEPVSYTNWYTSEPNDLYDGEDYAIMNWQGRGRWNDLGPSSPEWNFVTNAIIETVEPPSLMLRISHPGPDAAYGAMTLDGEDVSMETLLESFQNSPRIQERTLIIQAVRDVSHEQIVEVMDIAKRAGIPKLGFSKI